MKSTWKACAPHASPLHYAPFTHTCTTKHASVYRCTTYTYMHHIHTCAPHASLNTCVHCQTPPKIMIYLVGPPSALYERPGQNERSVLNQLFLFLLRCFSWKAYEKHMKSVQKAHAFHEKRRFSQKRKTTCKEV